MNTVPILCEENYLSRRNASEALCIKFVYMGVAFSLTTTKQKTNNLKTYGISLLLYREIFLCCCFLNPSLFLYDGLGWLVRFISLCSIFLRLKLPQNAWLSLPVADNLWLVSGVLHHQATSIFLLQLFESEKVLWLSQETCLLFLPWF